MAELQVNVPYKTALARVGYVIMCCLLPVWALAAPAALGFIIGRALGWKDFLPTHMVVAATLGLLAFIILSIFLTALAEDNRISVSKSGITFPLFCLPFLGFKRHLLWTEMIGASLIGSGGQDDTAKRVGRLVLAFDSGAAAAFHLRCFDNKDLEQLLLAIELWATNCKRAPELIEMQAQVANEGRKSESRSYTDMWEDDLRTRFAPTAFMPLEPGHKLAGGRLKVVSQLAFGGLSAIYLAQQNERDLVVLKEAVVPAGADDDTKKAAEGHLQREAELLVKLSHPHIAHVLDHFIDDGRHYLVLQHLNGQDLRQHVKQNGVLTVERACSWGLEILSILEYLHGQTPPVLHRDLTPENLVVDNNGRIILIDFGAANHFVGEATGTVVGKQAYIPAEQLRGKAVVQSDIYAFGGTLFFLVIGRDPLPLSVSRPSEFVSGIPSEFDDLVAHCTAFEPQDRLPSATAAREALARIAGRLGAEPAIGHQASV